jgi:pyruvate,water dikinase
MPKLSAWLSEVRADSVVEVGGKAASLGEIKNVLGLRVPDGYCLTTEAYRQFCGIPLWRSIRDAIRDADLSDLEGLTRSSEHLHRIVMDAPVPRAVEVAISERAKTLDSGEMGLAVRSSGVGEGGAQSFAGQFHSLINVPQDDVVDAYKRVIASRFSERALFYRLSTGLVEVESPMAVLFIPTIKARASGIMYTRDPQDARSHHLLITATRGLGLDIASGRMPADLFVVSRRRPHAVLERRVASKAGEILPKPGGGLLRRSIPPEEASSASLMTEDIQILADWAVRIEEHFGAPQDVEWAVDEEGDVWILQSRSLALAQLPPVKSRNRPRAEPILKGGTTVYPGRVSGKAHLAEDAESLAETPEGSILFMHRPSPEIVKVFPRINGLVAEWGNIAGHGAALLREFKVPSVFEMADTFGRIKEGDPVSLDAIQPRVYEGILWPPRPEEVEVVERYSERMADPISRRLLTLHLLDPSAFNFRPSGCKSTHDVLRFSHEKAIESMFAVNDREWDRGPRSAKRLIANVPINLYVLDLGGGLNLKDPSSAEVAPDQILSTAFQALWRGIIHPGVTWSREMPATLGSIASVMAGSFSSHSSARRALGDRSYLLVADEYMNLNSRLAYHFTLVDACLSAIPNNNYISFRFAGGGATRRRRNLRACFIEACLRNYGFNADRRGDVVNAWFKKAPREETAERLDLMGRLMACASQLDMYMVSHDAMRWYVKQFLEGNYAFKLPEEEPATSVKGR